MGAWGTLLSLARMANGADSSWTGQFSRQGGSQVSGDRGSTPWVATGLTAIRCQGGSQGFVICLRLHSSDLFIVISLFRSSSPEVSHPKHTSACPACLGTTHCSVAPEIVSVVWKGLSPWDFCFTRRAITYERGLEHTLHFEVMLQCRSEAFGGLKGWIDKHTHWCDFAEVSREPLPGVPTTHTLLADLLRPGEAILRP